MGSRQQYLLEHRECGSRLGVAKILRVGTVEYRNFGEKIIEEWLIFLSLTRPDVDPSRLSEYIWFILEGLDLDHTKIFFESVKAYKEKKEIEKWEDIAMNETKINSYLQELWEEKITPFFQRLTEKDKTELDSIKKYHFGDLYREDLLYYGHTDIMVWTLPAQEETVLSHIYLSTSLDMFYVWLWNDGKSCYPLITLGSNPESSLAPHCRALLKESKLKTNTKLFALQTLHEDDKNVQFKLTGPRPTTILYLGGIRRHWLSFIKQKDLSVPKIKGIGKKMIVAGLKYASDQNCEEIRFPMNVLPGMRRNIEKLLPVNSYTFFEKGKNPSVRLAWEDNLPYRDAYDPATLKFFFSCSIQVQDALQSVDLRYNFVLP